MSTIIVQEYVLPNCQYNSGVVMLRIYYTTSFLASDGTWVMAGAVGSNNFFDEIECTVVDDELTVPQFELTTTDDCLDPLQTGLNCVTGVFYQGSTQLDTWFSDFLISVSLGGTTNMSALRVFNAAVGITYPSLMFLTREQVAALLGTAAPGPHHSTHEAGGSDEIDVTGLEGVLADQQVPSTHATRHQNGGNDEINVGGLSGLLADQQTPLAHATSHQNGGSDEISVAGLSGVLADPQTPITENVQDIVGTMATDSAEVDFIYDDGLGTLTAELKVTTVTPGSYTNTNLTVDSKGRITAAASGTDNTGYDTVEEEGTPLTQRSTLNFTGAGVTASDSGGKTVVNVPGASGSGLVQGVVQGRLTTETGVPISTTDRTAQSTIYFTPYKGNQVALFDGATWELHTFTERSLALSGLTSGKNYDVFLFDNAGTLTLELSAAWASDTTRTDALALQDGIYVKSGATTRLYLGTIRTTSTTTTEDSGGIAGTTQVGGKRFVWNYYNQAARSIAVVDLTDSWSYTGTWRQADGVATNQVEAVFGLAGEGLLDLSVVVSIQNISNTTGTHAAVGIGVGSTTVPSGNFNERYFADASAHNGAVTCRYNSAVPLGYQFYAWIEQGAGTGTSLFLGDNAGACRSGITGTIWN